MTTVGDAVKSAIDTNWNVGTGGVEPVLYNSEDIGQGWPPDNDWVMILGWEYDRKRKRRNDTYISESYTIDMRVHSKNDANGEERLDEIVTEIYRIVTPTNVTGFHTVDIIYETRRASDKRTNRFIADLTVELVIKSIDGAAAPGSTTTSAITCDTLTVNTAVVGTLPVPGEIDMTGTGACIDLNPAGTGSKTIIDITPTAALAASSNWRGINQDWAALDSGAGSDLQGVRIDGSTMAGTNSDIWGFRFFAPAVASVGFEHALQQAAPYITTSFLSTLSDALTTSSTYRGTHIWFVNATRSATAPKLEGVRVELPASYANFGASYGGYFSGDGRSVTLCDTTYAADISGDYRLDGMTNAQLEDLLMFGSANAAYVPCVFEGADLAAIGKFYSSTTSGGVVNVDGTDNYLFYRVPLPTNRGGLKLYVDDVRLGVHTADAGDYVTKVRVHGANHTGITELSADASNRTAQGSYVSAFAAADASSYESVLVRVDCFCTDANDLILSSVELLCYYAA